MPKVDFNAGVVAAGEAIIESTVSELQRQGSLNQRALPGVARHCLSAYGARVVQIAW